MSAKSQEAAYQGPAQRFAPERPTKPAPDRSPRRIRELLDLLASSDPFKRQLGEWGLRGLGMTHDQAVEAASE